MALLVALVPLAGLAAGPTFNDLNAGSVHNPNIAAIADAGITKGCDPGVSYCPNGLVIREEMASFLARTAGIGANPPVANAKTAQTATSADTATTAANATQLNGQPASFYQPAGQPIANATNAGNAGTIGGYAPSALLRVARQLGTNRADVTPAPFRPLVVSTIAAGPPLQPALQAAVSLTVIAPANGFVLVSGAIYLQVSDSFAYARTRHAASGAVSPALLCGQRAVNSACSLSPVAAFPVTAGSHTFILEVARAGTGTVDAYDGTLTALYVPFGHDGGTTLAP